MKKSLKKTIAFLISATLLLSALPFSVSAAEAEGEAVAATEAEPVGAEETDSNVGAEEADSNVGAEADSEAVGSNNAIYFEVPSDWSQNIVDQGVFTYLYDLKDGAMITWGAKKGKMKKESDGKYSFDLVEKGFELASDHNYFVIFAAGSTWSLQTYDLLLGESCLGHTASWTGNMVENPQDSNKKAHEVVWDNGVDQNKYGPRLQITSIGNIVGKVAVGSRYDLLVQFLTNMLNNAREYSGKDDQSLVDDAASALGLGRDDVTKAVTGVSVEWSAEKSSLPGGSTSSGDGSSDGGSSSDPGSSSNSSSGSGGNGTPAANNTGTGGTRTVSSGSSTGSSTTTGGARSVTTGPETTVLFVLGGMMVAAAGILFLSRKKREY
ncbi:MAG: LPXTG cell wall anchor domain-containing protein [Ruminococcus sp.]|nr:LPXTG cell wall anchor domain-containing protein [Ruminococcus sp.]